MKHAFIDKYSELDSPLHRLDARLRLAVSFAAILMVVTVPRGQLAPFIAFAVMITALVFLSRVPWRFIGSRCLIISPFVILAAVSYPISAMIAGNYEEAGSLQTEWLVAISICCKAFLSVIILTLLVSTGRFSSLLHGMRQLYMPKLIGILSALLYRYVFIIYDEALRTTRARDSRTPGTIRHKRFKTYGNQAAMIFMRSWERSGTVFQAMVSRGFDGDFPGPKVPAIKYPDVLYVILFILLFLAARVFA